MTRVSNFTALHWGPPAPLRIVDTIFDRVCSRCRRHVFPAPRVAGTPGWDFHGAVASVELVACRLPVGWSRVAQESHDCHTQPRGGSGATGNGRVLEL